MNKIKRYIFVYIWIDLVLFIFSVYKGYIWIANTQIAFFSSLGIIVLSYFSYVKSINKQIKLVSDIIDERDFIDEVDDPYELYEENISDKKNRLKLSIKNLSKSKSAALSIFRILGYFLFICGFFLLLKLKIFSIAAYITGISIIPIGALVNILVDKRQFKKD